MKLCKDKAWRNHCVYCDNLFSSVQLLKDMLGYKRYCSGTIQVNRKYLLDGIRKPDRMIHGAYKSYQDGRSNLVATTWQDNRIVRLVSTNLKPKNVNMDRRFGCNVIQVNQPQNIQLCNRYMNGVDHQVQMCIKYDGCYFSVKAQQFILWYFVNTNIMNAYILYCKTLTRQTKRSMFIMTFDLRLQWDYLLDFHQEKGRQKLTFTLGLWELKMKTTMKMSTWAERRERDVNGTVWSKWGKELYMGVFFAMYTSVKMDGILPTIINNIKLLIIFFLFFWNFPWYLPKPFHECS